MFYLFFKRKLTTCGQLLNMLCIVCVCVCLWGYINVRFDILQLFCSYNVKEEVDG